MKPSQNVVDALVDIKHIEDGAQIRRVEMLLALARGEISEGKVDAAAKMVMALSANWATQLRKEAQAAEMRRNLALIGRRDEAA